ncbi:MAG TPA: hypothetical protein VEH52_13795 [Gaiellaceae bacterium]|nr:hypothetical protein [Gaiellaceae bacterium]
MPTRARVIVLVFLLASLARPGAAFAHAGKGVVGVDGRAELTSVPARGVEVKVIDRDQGLWARVSPSTRLVVLGIIGEPFLRFDETGVWLNGRSPTARVDGFKDLLQPAFSRTASPHWRRVARGRSYRWHDHRLHALAALGGNKSEVLGDWRVPVELDGRPTSIAGRFLYEPPPNLWLWLLPLGLGIVACAVALARGRGAVATTANIAAVITVPAVLIARAGRDLWGRPFVPTFGLVSLALACALACAAFYLIARSTARGRAVITLVIGTVGIYEGLALRAALDHSFVLSALPSDLERAAVAVALGAGVPAAILSVLE